MPKVAIEAWIGCALLQQEDIQGSFTPMDITERFNTEIADGKTTGPLRPGVLIHATIHNLANHKPVPNRLKLLIRTTDDRRRLFRSGDPVHPGRINGPTILDKADELPECYLPLLKWYEEVYLKANGLAQAHPV